jgi:hypothetical protein
VYRQDAMIVVDGKLNVYGVEHLRIADAVLAKEHTNDHLIQ